MFIDATLFKGGGLVAGTITSNFNIRPAAAASLLLAVCLLLSGCSAVQLGYEALPTVARWQVDRHLGLDGDQTALLVRHLDELQRWHRAHELPAYAATLEAMERELRIPADAETVAGWRRKVFAAWTPLAERLAPGFVEIAATLRPEQFAALALRYERNNAEFRSAFVEGSPQVLAERRGDRVVRRAERFLGSLSGSQEREVRRWSAALPAIEADWFAERRTRQERLQVLAQGIATGRIPRDEALARTRAVLVDLWVSPDPARRARIEAAGAASDAIAARILNLATPRQIAALRENVAQYVADFRALAATP